MSEHTVLLVRAIPANLLGAILQMLRRDCTPVISSPNSLLYYIQILVLVLVHENLVLLPSKTLGSGIKHPPTQSQRQTLGERKHQVLQPLPTPIPRSSPLSTSCQSPSWEPEAVKEAPALFSQCCNIPHSTVIT